MRFLQLVTADAMNAGPPDPEHMQRVNASIRAGIESGAILATGGLGRRATSAARVTLRKGEFTVEDPPTGDGWMAASGYSVAEFASKEDAIAQAKATLEQTGDGVLDLIQVTEMHPTDLAHAAPDGTRMSGVIPYVNVEGASEAAAFYQKAFGAKEVMRMPSEDGTRLMHCHLIINGGSLMLADTFPEYGYPLQRSHSFTMQLVLRDAQSWWDRAVAAGCTVRQPLEVAFWGDLYGALQDPFGVHWAMNQPAGKH